MRSYVFVSFILLQRRFYCSNVYDIVRSRQICEALGLFIIAQGILEVGLGIHIANDVDPILDMKALTSEQREIITA